MIGAKDRNNLFLIAQVEYDLPKGVVATLLREAGYYRFDVSLWDKYIALFRAQWEKNVQALMTEKERVARLIQLEGTLTIAENKDCWYWFGSEEALAAHWELETKRREERRKFCRRNRMYSLEA